MCVYIYVYIKTDAQFQLLVNGFAHCVKAVLWAPHCGDWGLYHLQGIRLPGVSMDHVPNTGHH